MATEDMKTGEGGVRSMGKWRRIGGWVLSGLIGLALTGSAMTKLLGVEEAVKMLSDWGLGEWVKVIGVGELVSTILYLVPRTSVLGVLLLSSYLGGAIVTHMQHNDAFTAPAVLLVLMWVASFLRMPELLGRLMGAK